MSAFSCSAQCRERRASNALAGCSGAPTCIGAKLQPCSPPTLFRESSLPSGSSRCTWLTARQKQNTARQSSRCRAAWGTPQMLYRKKRRRWRQCQGTLDEADYEVYRMLAVDQITEEFLWQRLRPLLHYLDVECVKKVQRALSFAVDVHSGQMRKSGEPYITHPLEVARLLAELRMDTESLCAGLLHDTVEDNPHVASFEEIEMEFGSAVRTIVEGETKFSKLGELSSEMVSKGDVKARDLQHLFLAMTKEVRIIVVKLADRLHNMRTLGSMPPHKQKKIAEETLQVFAPLARLLGLYSIKEELEELAFSYSMPEEYAPLRLHLDRLAKEQGPMVLQARDTLQALLDNDTFLKERAGHVEIAIMQKSAYSVYRKLEGNISQLNDVTDVAQLCVVIPRHEGLDSILYGTNTQLCYHVMGLVHLKWPPIPGSFKDYIATPKRNGYQSLHTTVLPLGSTPLFPLEVHIRNSKMQSLAEFGIAGEKWVAKKEQAPRPQTTVQSPSLVSGGQQPLDRRSGRPWPGYDLMGGMLRVLPRMLGLGIPSAAVVNGFAVNGAVLSAEQQAHLNARSKRPFGSSYMAREMFQANVITSEDGMTAVNGVIAQAQGGSTRLSRDVMKRREHWLKSIIEWQTEFLDSLTAQEFVDGITDDLLGRGVFVFTPSGEIMRLPKDSTTVDFAYHVHTDVGNQMVGAKVNGKLVEPDHIVCNAEVVEILTYNGHPTALSVSRHFDWAKFTKSRTARHKLAKFLKEHGHLLPEQYRAQQASETQPVQTRDGLDSRLSNGKLLQPKDSKETVWLAVEGDDRPGLLAEVAQIMSKHGHNVKTYSGSVNPASGTLSMRFEVQGLRDRFAEMCAEIGAAPFVRSWRVA